MDSRPNDGFDPHPSSLTRENEQADSKVDAYFSADVETDGPIPGPYSILSFALVYAGSFGGREFKRPDSYERTLYKELRPISENFEPEALQINGLNRSRLCVEGEPPEVAMTEACRWVKGIAGSAQPVLVAYPLSFDWSWLYWYFVRFSAEGSPFAYSRCFDIKTALAVKAAIPISEAGRSQVDLSLRSKHPHTHHAVDDAVAQAEIFANVFEWEGIRGRTQRSPV
jgi:Exonuclease